MNSNKKICQICGKEFEKKPSESNKYWSKKKYCSRSCSNKAKIGKETWNKGLKGVQVAWNKGIPQSDSAKKLNSEKHKGRRYLNRKRISEEDRDKIRQTLLGKYARGELVAVIPKPRRGEENHNWKGGISSENDKIRKSSEYKLWRKTCFERDNFTCQISGQYGGELVVHHINNFADFPEIRTSIKNGITMTKELHFKFHSMYGKKNNTKEQLDEFIREIKQQLHKK
jgi:hypothetical protein